MPWPDGEAWGREASGNLSSDRSPSCRLVKIINLWWKESGEWLRCVTMLNSLCARFLWERCLALVCEWMMEPVIGVSCGNDADRTNANETIDAVTSRLAHVKKGQHAWPSETPLSKRNKLISSRSFSSVCFCEFQWSHSRNFGVFVRTLVDIYIYIYVYIRTYVFVWFWFGCMFVWLVRLWVCWVPLLVVEPLGSFVGGPPLLYLVEQEFISFTRR